MFAAIAVIFVLLAFSVFLIYLFGYEITQIIMNIPILWLILLRAQAHIQKEKRALYYWIGLIITTVLFLILPLAENTLRFYIWWPTLFIVFIFLIAQSAFYIHKNAKKR